MQPQSPESGIKAWQWAVTAIVVIVLIVVGVMVFSGKSTAPVAVVQNPTDTAGNNTSGVSSIIMSDQYPGNVVYVSSVQMANPGWVVIHKDASGIPGAIIGEAYVGTGINPVKITLDSPMIDGSTYYAMLHSDDGNQKFDVTTDVPLKDGNGNIIMHVFHASTSAGAGTKG